MAIKRLRYFDNQFLVEADFTVEQKYHLDMRRRLNRALHTFGIAEGLEVAKSGNKTVTVRPGTALDRDGREIIVETDQVINLPAQAPAGETIFIAIAYQEKDTDPSKTGIPGNTRVTERFIPLEAVTTAPPTDGTVVRLASFKLDGSANVPGNVNDLFDGGVRKRASSVTDPGSDLAVRSLALTDLSLPSNQWPSLRLGAANRADLTGSLHVSGDASVSGKVGIGTTTPNRNLTISQAGATTGVFENIKNNSHELLVGVDSVAIVSAMTASDLHLRTNNSTRVVVQANTGNVGIGTATPAGRLHIGAARPDIFLVGNTTANQDGLRIHYDETGGLRTGVIDVKGLSLRLRGESGTTGDGATDRFFINLTTGNVGIGTTNPAEPLEVNGRTKSGPLTVGPWPANASYAFFGANTLNQAAAGNYALLQGTTDGPGRTYLNSPVDIRFRIGNADRMLLANNGNVGMLLGSNPIFFTGGWSASPDQVTNVSEISNDVGVFQTLMIVGNRSFGLGRRVSVWDRFEVNGIFVNASSVEVKQDVHALLDDDYRDILDKIEKTPLFRYRFRASGIDQKQRVGVIAEEAPEDILDETGKCVSLLDYVGFLFAGLKAQAKVMNKLVRILDGPQQNVGL